MPKTKLTHEKRIALKKLTETDKEVFAARQLCDMQSGLHGSLLRKISPILLALNIARLKPATVRIFRRPARECRCTGAIIQRYLGKLSGPLLDRIDLLSKCRR